MSFWSAVAVALAGTGAGLINTIVGSGTLITFPTLLFFGVNPLVANVSNNIGLVAGGVTGAWGYRHELTGQAPALRRLVPLSFVGSVVGASLLLVLPAAAFRAIVPVLILIALVLVLAGPRIQARVHPEGADRPVPGWHAPAMGAGVFVAGVYGGYFGAAQGVLLMGLFSALSLEPLQRLNGYKNVLSLVVNVVAAGVFVLFARDHIDWLVVLLVAVGAFVGGIIGAKVGRRIPPAVLRGLIVLIGVVAIVKLVWFP
ncbi:sulfite exporter TauE/SafE family protein [Terrabacter aeriphilus]|uniref:Probable membrane transporter protein n=1 Tax=Terrabacter aeriphilus TaxID=515662 RepID=A0ABP9JN11_9MICO